MDETQNIIFTLDEVNQMLNYLAEQPAKYSMDLINFIKTKAQSQIEQPTVDDEQVETKEE